MPTETQNTPEFRAIFVKVFEPEMNDLKKRLEYSLIAAWPPGTDLSNVKQLCKQAAIDKWGPDPEKWPENLKLPFRDQSEKVRKDKNTGMTLKDENGQPILMDGFEAGGTFVTLSTQYQPAVVDANVQSIIDPTQFYSGCYAIAAVHAFAWGPTKGGFGVSLGLDALQKTRDGESLGGGGRIKPEDAFKPAAGAAQAGQSEAPAGGSAASMFD